MLISSEEENEVNAELKNEIYELFGQDFEIDARENGMVIFSNVSKHNEFYFLDDGQSRLRAEAVAGINSNIGQVETGKDGIISGVINGGKRFCAATYRELGFGKYRDRNEDNIGVDYAGGVLVLADGMGGHGYGELASHLIVEGIIRDNAADLRPRLYGVRDKLYLFGRKMGLTFAPDAAFEAVKLSGDRYTMAYRGDGQFLHIRGKKCIYRNIPCNVAWAMYMQGQISYVGTFNDAGRTILTNSLLRGGGMDFTEREMEAGDKLVMYDDGLAYCDSEVVEIVSGHDADEAVRILTEGTKQRNMKGTDRKSVV
jgi:protein phosphatase